MEWYQVGTIVAANLGFFFGQLGKEEMIIYNVKDQ